MITHVYVPTVSSNTVWPYLLDLGSFGATYQIRDKVRGGGQLLDADATLASRMSWKGCKHRSLECGEVLYDRGT